MPAQTVERWIRVREHLTPGSGIWKRCVAVPCPISEDGSFQQARVGFSFCDCLLKATTTESDMKIPLDVFYLILNEVCLPGANSS